MIAYLSCAIWIYLVFLHGSFWRSRPELPRAIPQDAPDVDIVVPARDEAATIAPVIASLAAQEYRGRFRVILVDDGSSDGTAALAGSDVRLTTLSGEPKPPGWSGKLWALRQGIAAGNAPLVFCTDADIVHAPAHLSALVAALQSRNVVMVSEMVRLNCTSLAERALVPAFVYFFQMLYPFAKVNDPRSTVAAAAGGTVLIRRDVLRECGGIEAIKGALIDDVALARLVKPHAPIYLGHSGLAASIRPYPHWADLWQMIARTAFTQLRYSAMLLVLTLLGLALVWLAPPGALLFGHGAAAIAGLFAVLLAMLSYLPTLARYGRNPLWTLGLPAIALFYMGATVASAAQHWFGTGARWKNRAYESSPNRN
jgi:hopene-associated glycosyltransferase HpnB